MFNHRRGRAWAALITCRHWWRIQCPLCPCMWVEKNEKEAQISVLLGFLECSTNGSITGQDSQLTFWCLVLLKIRERSWLRLRQPTHCYCLSFESTRRQNISWESCTVIDPALVHAWRHIMRLISKIVIHSPYILIQCLWCSMYNLPMFRLDALVILWAFFPFFVHSDSSVLLRIVSTLYACALLMTT